ncbi:MAG: DsbA family protein [Nanohaloarchaea archaeon]|nr:DsbA family protein [Candidatus Nanohaloarchaea archaeon]
MTDDFECDKCGDSFDSERGLKVHTAQMHNGEDSKEQPKTNTEEPEASTNSKISVSKKNFVSGVFILGLALGFIGGIYAPVPGDTSEALETTGSTAPEIDSEGSQNADTNTGSEVVTLQETKYPYGNLNHGVGSGTITKGNKTFDVEGEPYIGSEDSEVTMVAFEDFECPFCNRFNNNAFPSIVENHVRAGEARYYWKNFPLQRLHPWAEASGVAAECALNQDSEAFWIFKNGFFNNQDALNNVYKSDQAKFDQSMKKWASQIGLDTEKFNSCYDNQEELEEVQEDQQQGSELGVSGTPTVFVNDQKLVGAQPYSKFESAINSKLGQ